MRGKKFKQDDIEENIEEEESTPVKKNKKKGKKLKEPEVPKRPLIERLDEELNQIEYCNFTDTTPTKLNFDTSNRPYFQSYFLDKLLDAKFKKTNVLNLNSVSLNDECLDDLLNLKRLIENDSFRGEYDETVDEAALVKKLEGFFSNIEILDLSDNKLVKMPLRLIKLFTNLKHLKLSDNSIHFKNSDLNELTGNDSATPVLKTIEYLNLENNKLDANLAFIGVFKHVRYLNLSNNFITSLNLGNLIAQLPKLVDLNVASNQQKNDSQLDLTRQRVEHSNLRKLNLRNLNLNNLIYNLEGYMNLEHLILDENQLEFIPTQIYELEKLKSLSINSNKLNEISEKFCLKSKFRFNLQQLNLSNNLLQTENFSEKFYLFKALTKLDLSGNKLKYIPNTLPESLRELKLNSNRLLTLMVRPVRLLTNNSITCDDDADEIELLRQRVLNSTTVYQTTTQAQHLNYATVFYLRSLEYLDLSSNQLQEIPNDFGLLNVSLKYLNLSCNLIKQLDIKLCCRGLHNLKYLNLSSNFIKYIPEQICEFKQLEYLYLNHNSIQYLNYELCNELSSLIELDLSFNQLTELPLFLHTRNKIQAITLAQALTMNQESTEFSNLFTFSLKNLKKINLSSNGIQGVFLFHVKFQQCTNLAEVDLSLNNISSLKFENEVSPQQQQQQQQPIIDQPVKQKRKFVLKELNSINLSNNQISLNNSDESVNKRLLKFLLKFYKLAPNLKTFHYDQLNGLKVNATATAAVVVAMETEIENPAYTDLEIEELLVDYEAEYESLRNSLQVINLSNNNLYRIPSVLFKMNNLKEIYLNGNYIQKIPSSILHVTRTISLIDNQPAVKQQTTAATASTTDAAAANATPTKRATPVKTEVTQLPALIENIEILELNDNKLEQVPENLFMHFKNLKNLTLQNNPLREPPRDAICAASYEFMKGEVNTASAWSTTSSGSSSSNNNSTLFDDELENDLLNDTLATTVSALNDDDIKLAPMRSYMIKYKKREEMLLVNMFVTIKDSIDSTETLLKLMRRLKMPMDKVEIVCKEIAENIKQNWTKRLDKTQLRIKKKDLPKIQREYTLRIQTWKLLNIWRQLYGIDAHSDELLRVLNLMNSNEFEEALLNKVKTLKYYSSAVKI